MGTLQHINILFIDLKCILYFKTSPQRVSEKMIVSYPTQTLLYCRSNLWQGDIKTSPLPLPQSTISTPCSLPSSNTQLYNYILFPNNFKYTIVSEMTVWFSFNGKDHCYPSWHGYFSILNLQASWTTFEISGKWAWLKLSSILLDIGYFGYFGLAVIWQLSISFLYQHQFQDKENIS